MPRLFLTLSVEMIIETPALADERDWTPELHTIADKCGVPRANLTWVDGSVHWSMPEMSSFDQAA